MKVFISQPMTGRTKEEILNERNEVIEELRCKSEYEVLDSYFEDYDPQNGSIPIKYLAKSIDVLAEADAKNLAVGEKIAISGRIQSREYQKRITDDDVCTLTAYEVSISKLLAYENVENFDITQEFGLFTCNAETQFNDSAYIN